MANAIDAIVAAYVTTGNIDALAALKNHRMALLTKSTDRDDYSFAVVRTELEADIASIDSGLQRLQAAITARATFHSD